MSGDSNSEPVMDWAPLKQYFEILGDVANSAIEDLVATFISDSPRHITGLKAGLDASDPEKVRASAHTLKGSSGTMGAKQLSEYCRLLELAAKNGEVEKLPSLFKDVESSYTRSVEALKEWREHLN